MGLSDARSIVSFPDRSSGTATNASSASGKNIDTAINKQSDHKRGSLNNAKKRPVIGFRLIHAELGKIVSEFEYPVLARVLTAISCEIVRGANTIDLAEGASPFLPV